jgi:peptidoglycan/LPS O-acetylase OafA/YrhL
MRVESLNVFRFIAVIIVINFHYGKLYPGFLTSGPEMVTFFFVLSGAVLVLTYYEREKFSSKEFFLKRIKKLYPSYLIALITVAYLSNNVFDDKLLLSLLAIQAWFPPHALDLNFPAWAISSEVFFYLSFPVVLYILKEKGKNPYYVLFFALSFWAITQFIIISLLNPNFYKISFLASHNLIFYFPPSHFCSFLLGVAIGYLTVKRGPKLPKTIAYASFIISAAMIYFVCEYKSMIRNLVGLYLPFDSSFLAPAFSLFILSIIINNNIRVFKYLSNKLFIILGASSYELYIFQTPIFRIFSSHLGISNFYIVLFFDIFLSILIYILLSSKRTIILPLLILISLLGMISLMPTDGGQIWQEVTTQPVGEILGNMTIGQTFIAPYSNLHAIEIALATYKRVNTKEVIFHLSSAPSSASDLVTIKLSGDKITDNQYHRFSFDPIADSKGRSFYFFVESPNSTPGNAITIWYNEKDAYKEGQAYENGSPIPGDLAFKALSTSRIYGLITALRSVCNL